MYLVDFCNAIQHTLAKLTDDVPSLSSTTLRFFLAEIAILESNKESKEIQCITQATILFEGFYRHVEDEVLKNALLLLREKRWKSHFGTPTILFLLSYNTMVEQTKLFFDSELFSSEEKPWHIEKESSGVIDETNHILTAPKCSIKAEVSLPREQIGLFTKTYNPFGGFTTAPCDPVSQAFIHEASTIAKTGGKMLEIGAAFGAATLEALAKGATVFCNDIDADNLAVVQQRYLNTMSDIADLESGDTNKLVFIPGAFPQELKSLPDDFFDAILICRVLHFFTGTKIDSSLALVSRILKPGGKIYIVCETPYLKNWQAFIPEFKHREALGIEWPGEITTPAAFESSGRATSLPTFVHWITKEVLARCLGKAKLTITHLDYINREGQFPSDLLLDGRESIGAISIK